jgi:diguanylate cyclase (GGDEF)-like protein
VLGALAGYGVIIVAGFLTVRPTPRAFITTAVFAALAVASAEVSMRFAWPRARKDRASRDFLGVWTAPVAFLLPPPYVAAMVAVPLLYTQMRVWRRDPIKLAFSIASIGLGWAGCSMVVAAVLGHRLGTGNAAPFAFGGREVLAITAGVATWYVINHAMIGGVIALTSGRSAVQAMFMNGEGVLIDVIDVCVGIVVALLWRANPYAIVLLVPAVLFMQHQLFSGLRQAVRTDLLTNVANPQFWREVASREIERAWASAANLAILMIDIDHFKQVNDRHGHLAGDDVLSAVARAIARALRPSDLVGRLGGEEFGAILSGLNIVDAEGAAERLRCEVAEVRVRSDRGEWIGVTVSVGVAELSVTQGSLHTMLDAADNALYAAKAAGRNRVRVAGPHAGQVIDLRQPRVIDVNAPDARSVQRSEL